MCGWLHKGGPIGSLEEPAGGPHWNVVGHDQSHLVKVLAGPWTLGRLGRPGGMEHHMEHLAGWPQPGSSVPPNCKRHGMVATAWILPPIGCTAKLQQLPSWWFL